MQDADFSARLQAEHLTAGMKDCRHFYIDGKWVSPAKPRDFIVLNPATEQPIATISLGFKTIVHPAASAGATLQAIWFIGQFQGVISPHTPIGSFRISVEPLSSSNLN